MLTADRRHPRSARLLAAPTAVVLALGALTGCAAGFDATATQDYAPADGLKATSGDLRVLNALVVRAEGADDGLVSLTVSNRGERDDRVTDLTSDSGTVTLEGDAAVPAGGSLHLGADGTTATVSGLEAEAGRAVELTIRFARAEPVTLRTVVVPADGEYASLTPAASPSAGPTTSETASPSPSETES